jgi:OmpA-OmpF porin, OOP family
MRKLIASLLVLGCASAWAQTSAPAAATSSAPAANQGQSGMVTASGTLPDEATKAAVLDNLRKLYGADHVVDRIEVGGVVTPANWSKYVVNMIGPNLKQVSNGQVQIQGNSIDISGDVPNEATRQQVLSTLSTSFDQNYGIKQNLRIGASKQQVLDQTLANRVVQFESGSAILTPAGRAVLDQMAAAILKINNPSIQVIGNTDNVGDRQSNIALSLARANTVKAYLVAKSIPASTLSVSGQGPDNPVADNNTDEGRARNRRIDFKIATAQ